MQRQLEMSDDKRIWNKISPDKLRWIEMDTDEHMALIFNPELAKKWVSYVEDALQS